MNLNELPGHYFTLYKFWSELYLRDHNWTVAVYLLDHVWRSGLVLISKESSVQVVVAKLKCS